MRISDWSSDVCSSDLNGASGDVEIADAVHPAIAVDHALLRIVRHARRADMVEVGTKARPPVAGPRPEPRLDPQAAKIEAAELRGDGPGEDVHRASIQFGKTPVDDDPRHAERVAVVRAGEIGRAHV